MDNLFKVYLASVLVSFAFLGCEGANILVMLPLPLYSHTIAYMPIINELANRGHKITVVTPFPQPSKHANINEVIVPPLYEEITDPSMFVLTKRNALENLKIFWDFGLRGSKVALEQEPVRRVLSLPPESFDLVMTETFFLLEPMSALGHKFKCPLVNLHPWTLTVPIAYFSGNPILSSAVPSVYSSHTADMTLLQRTNNALLDLLELAGYHLYYLPRQDEMMRKQLGEVEGFAALPPLPDLLRATSLTLIDAHHALDFSKPYFRNVVEIGGLTLLNKQPVPKELQKYMDDSKQGFVLFSLGSHLPSAMLPIDFKINLFKALGKLKQNVIMKWGDLLEEKPKNVRIEKWLPQLEILSHKNCKVFVSHGGLHAVQEAVHHQVPLVGIPLVADQHINIKFVEHSGLGLSVDVFQTTEEQLTRTIETVIYEPRFKQAASERSSLFKDNPVSTIDNAVYHIEFLLRHQNSSVLHPPTLQRTWYELLLLDVWALLIITIGLLISSGIALIKMISIVFQTLRRGKKKTKTH